MKRIINFFGTWTGLFVGVFLFIFFIAQVFVVPSGSMNPALKIGDRVLGLKFSYGVPIPALPIINQRLLPDIFGTGHLISAEGPRKNDVVVFGLPLNNRLMFVKRCVANGGEEIIFTKKHTYFKFNDGFKGTNPKSKIVKINGEDWIMDPYVFANYNPEDKSAFEKMIEIYSSDKKNQKQKNYKDQEFAKWLIATSPKMVKEIEGNPFVIKNEKFNAFYIKVPKDTYFMMGDNRDNSWDSRFWGSVEYKYIVAKMFLILFSSEPRSYEQVLNGKDKGLSDRKLLKKVCSGNITSEECKKKWYSNEKGKVRKERIFTIVK